MEMIIFLGIGLLAGWASTKILKTGSNKWVKNLAVGVVGSFLGKAVFYFVGFQSIGLVADIVVAIVGSLLLVYLLGKTKF